MHDVLPSTRRVQIADRLRRGTSVVAAGLAVEFGVSEDAIRRDLRALAAEGRCRRTYGGALPVFPAAEPMVARAGADLGRKRALARAAVGLVRPGETLFLDNGSANLALAGLLPDGSGLTVVTNAVLIAAECLRRPGLRLIVVGGAVDPEVGGCVDARATAEVQGMRFDRCFLGACAIASAGGIAAFAYADALFKRELLPRSAEVATMITTAKLDTRAPYGVAGIGDVDHIVVEHDAPAAARSGLAAAGATVMVADPH